MMNADKTVLYSGLPQDDWNNRPKGAKILSTGPNFLSSHAKSRKAALKTFFLIIFALCVIALLLVIGFHIFEFPGNKFFTFWETPSNEPDDAIVGASNTEEANTSQRQPFQDKEEFQWSSPPPVEELDNEGGDLRLNEQLSSTAQNKVENTTTLEVEMKGNSITNLPPEITTILPSTAPTMKTTTMVLNSSKSENNSADGLSNNNSIASKELISNATTSKPENYEDYTSDMTNSAMNNSTLDIESYMSLNNNSSSHLASNFSSNGTLAEIFIEISRYFNSTDLNEDDVRNWFEHLTSKPSLEVILIAAGIIFVGLSLLVIGLTCVISKRGKVRRRRERIQTSSRDFENNEKVILLASDDASEDEFVKA